MNKHEVLAAIESGDTVLYAKSPNYLASGEDVRLLGYEYRTPDKWERWRDWTAEEWTRRTFKPGTRGVLVEHTNPKHYRRYEVVPLRLLFATTRAKAQAAFEREARERDADNARRIKERDVSLAEAKQLVAQLGLGTVDINYSYGLAYIRLTTVEAAQLINKLATQPTEEVQAS